VTIYGDSLNHAKGAIADESHGALFSANFDAHHGLDSGVEMGTRLDGTPALAEALRYFEHAIAFSDQVFELRPTQAALDRRLAAGWRRPWPLDTRLRVRADQACWQALTRSAEPPVLYVQADDGLIDLLAGHHRFRLGRAGPDGRRALTQGPEADRTAAEVLAGWFSFRRPRDEPEPKARGFCPAVLVRSAS
jgi:hypothetical protein